MKMAKKQSKVYLGYEEEIISEKNQTLLNYTVNKIGGFPNWPPLENIKFPSKCSLCGLHRLLIVQCYAPLENSLYHRTLYVFACINPNCWIQSDGWVCVRSQILDQPAKETSTIVSLPAAEAKLSWCTGEDEWSNDNNDDSANGNFMSLDNVQNHDNAIQRNSDEDDESNSYEMESVELALGNLQMYDVHNANMSPVQGAVGAIGAPVAAAEFESGDEPGLVSVETPTTTATNIEALLLQTAELPLDIRSRLTSGPLQFLPKYIYVEEEWNKFSYNEDRVTELLNKYTKENEPLDQCGGNECAAGGGGSGAEIEQYEEATPLHGDRLFHAFLTRIRAHPLQILRYTREASPLLGAPLPSNSTTPESPCYPPAVCTRCGSPLICELQLVPSFADTLQLLHPPANTALSHLHFLSVLVFACSRSCWQENDTLVEESVVFQPEVV